MIVINTVMTSIGPSNKVTPKLDMISDAIAKIGSNTKITTKLVMMITGNTTKVNVDIFQI